MPSTTIAIDHNQGVRKLEGTPVRDRPPIELSPSDPTSSAGYDGAMFSAVGLVAVALLVVANGFFVAAEFALVAARRSRIEQVAEEGNVSAQLARELIRHLDAYIAACQ